MESKITNEVAQAEFDKWFESKKIPKIRREGDAKGLVDEMVCAIEEGYVIINDDNSVSQLLRFPLSTGLKQLDFASRVQAGPVAAKTAWAKDDKEQKLFARIAMLTGQEGGTIRALDSIDHSIASVISAFY